MAGRNQFTFYASYYEGISHLKKADQAAVLLAICAYALNGEEPNLKGYAAGAFALIRPTLDASRRKSENGRRGGRPKKDAEGEQEQEAALLSESEKANEKQTESKTQANEKQNESKIENEVEVEIEVEKEKEIEYECTPPVSPSEPSEKQGGGEGTESSAPTGLDRSPGPFPDDHPAMLLAAYLAKRISRRLPTMKPPEKKELFRWAGDLDKCSRLDGHGWKEIQAVLKFSQDDAFWQQNILSGRKFREKYPQLLAKMQGSSAGTQTATQNPFLQRMMDGRYADDDTG